MLAHRNDPLTDGIVDRSTAFFPVSYTHLVAMVPILHPAFARVRIANEIRMQFRRERKSGQTAVCPALYFHERGRSGERQLLKIVLLQSSVQHLLVIPRLRGVEGLAAEEGKVRLLSLIHICPSSPHRSPAVRQTHGRAGHSGCWNSTRCSWKVPAAPDVYKRQVWLRAMAMR